MKNRADEGAKFDLRAVVYVDGVRVGASVTRCISGVVRSPDLATEVAGPFRHVTPASVAAGGVVSLKLQTRIGTNADGTMCSGAHNTAAGLRVYYDAVSRAARFTATSTS